MDDVNAPNTKWYLSKTLWLALLTAAAALLADPDVLAVLPAAWLPKITLASAVAAAVVRLVTRGPVIR